jgi:cell division transport system permease protein
MKSIKNHISLILALVSILFAIQTLTITNRALDAYKENLKNAYSLVVVSNNKQDLKTIKSKSNLIEKVEEIPLDDAIKKIDNSISKKNLELLKATLPRFYKVVLSKYPTPSEIESLKKGINSLKGIKKVEDFKASYDITYKFLSLFQIVVTVFSIVVFIITTLLIVKELRIWQYKHKDRMNIMGLFGSPTWLSSAVLFRLAIVDAVLSSVVIFVVFGIISTNGWLISKFKDIGIDIMIFDMVNDFLLLFASAMVLSLLLATTIVFSHKEEV